MQTISIAIHGGAGTILQSDMTPALETAYKEALQAALYVGYNLLDAGSTALEAVEAAVVSLEDNPLFNAGRGSVFTKEGVQEMDAAIMNGKDQSAGAVAGIRNVSNPITLARAILQHSDHVFLAGKGALDFAIKQGIPLQPDEYFFSQFRYDQWKQMRDSDGYALDHSQQKTDALLKDKKFGTVGAVACDAGGNIAAATSTGGMTNKRYGRIGDSPVIGAGTYANNATCAISCTGHGEPFIKAVAAFSVAAMMEYKGTALSEAMQEIVHKKLIALEGEGGMIGVDAQGNIAMEFNSAGMYRAFKNSNGAEGIMIYKDSYSSVQ